MLPRPPPTTLRSLHSLDLIPVRLCYLYLPMEDDDSLTWFDASDDGDYRYTNEEPEASDEDSLGWLLEPDGSDHESVADADEQGIIIVCFIIAIGLHDLPQYTM